MAGDQSACLNLEVVSDQVPPPHRKIRIFVASPGELLEERDQLTRVIDEIRLTLTALAPEKTSRSS